ncbi:uncharacterized protein LOC142990489 [Genypterus blacodes]|uniref:uncharacterized protein LOC142990489 n=1 Tax=Genypterus blacodes TaxID=154954 RepID=UPI003F75D8B2
MELKDSIKGGVWINHCLLEGKHHYEVENVIKIKKANGVKSFVRKGDKLLLINNIDLQDLPPEEFAQILAEGNPKVTVHKAPKMKEAPAQPRPAGNSFLPVSKEVTLLSFCMEMRREEDLKEDEGGEGGGGGGGEEGFCPVVEEVQEEDLLIVSMVKTSISVVAGRSCETVVPCKGCDGTPCALDDVVIVSESSSVTLVPRGTFKQLKQTNATIAHAASHQYLQAICSQRILRVSPEPEKITIYQYKPNDISLLVKGVAVVLNFTHSNCFLRCCKDGDSVFLRVETCAKQKLKEISSTDQCGLSFVFYMKSTRAGGRRRFESALHAGWFIHIVNEAVEIKPADEFEDEAIFVIYIQS